MKCEADGDLWVTEREPELLRAAMSRSSLRPVRTDPLDISWVAGLLLAAFAGWAIARGQILLAFIPILVVLGLVLMSSLSLTGWCVLLLLSTVASRGLVQSLHLPSLLIFLHYPVVVVFAYLASNRPHSEGTKIPANRWLFVFALLVTLSSLVNSTGVLRIAMYVVIVSEPLWVIWAIQRWGVDLDAERRFLRVFWCLLALQVPLGLWQGLTKGWQDPVQGTMLGMGSGSHVLGGLFVVGLFVWLARVLDGRYPLWTVPFVLLIAFGMTIATGALQVTLLGGLSMPLVAFLGRGHRRGRSHPFPRWLVRRRVMARFVLGAVVVMVAILTPLLGQKLLPDLRGRVIRVATLNNFPELTLPLERAGFRSGGLVHDPESGPIQAVVGSGPGTSSSRAALLLVPGYEKGGTLSSYLASKPTQLAEDIAQQAAGPNGGSLESAVSEILAIVGDLGILGLVGFLLLILGIVRASRRAGSWLAPAIGAVLVMTLLLCFINTWLEYPEYAVPLALLVGLATSPHRDGAGGEAVFHRWDRMFRSDSSAHTPRS